jgi:hypothetical protein
MPKSMNKVRDREHVISLVRQHLDDIARNGTLEFRIERGRSPGYTIRFRYHDPVTGAVRQRRLTINDDPELHDLVRPVIWDRMVRRMQARKAKAKSAGERQKARAAEAKFIADYLGSRRERRLARRAYRESIATGKPFLIAMVHILSARPPRKRAGRKLKSRLW